MSYFLYYILVILMKMVRLHSQEFIKLCNSSREIYAGIWTSNQTVYIHSYHRPTTVMFKY